LRNYPERLAYSATPPDFGSLLIQRRRWANGGLIVMPKLIRHLVRTPRLDKVVEGFFRCHYLGSIAIVNLGLLIMMAFPFGSGTESLWLPFTALPYFFLYARDLAQAGYRKLDFAHIYALNLLLIPINLGGVFKSIEQAITRKKIPFGRTPKVLGRTAAPALYLLAEHALLVWWAIVCVQDIGQHRWAHAAFTAINSAFLAFAIVRYIGWTAVVEDLHAELRRLFASLTLQ
jgi:cellulose synthase (UDP-forming)